MINKPIKPESGSYIWCIVVSNGAILPLGTGKSIEYAKTCQYQYGMKNLKLFRLVPVEVDTV